MPQLYIYLSFILFYLHLSIFSGLRKTILSLFVNFTIYIYIYIYIYIMSICVYKDVGEICVRVLCYVFLSHSLSHTHSLSLSLPLFHFLSRALIIYLSPSSFPFLFLSFFLTLSLCLSLFPSLSLSLFLLPPHFLSLSFSPLFLSFSPSLFLFFLSLSLLSLSLPHSYFPSFFPSSLPPCINIHVYVPDIISLPRSGKSRKLKATNVERKKSKYLSNRFLWINFNSTIIYLLLHYISYR